MLPQHSKRIICDAKIRFSYHLHVQLAVCNVDCLRILTKRYTLVVEIIASPEIVFCSVMSIFDVSIIWEKVKEYRKTMDLPTDKVKISANMRTSHTLVNTMQ